MTVGVTVAVTVTVMVIVVTVIVMVMRATLSHVPALSSQPWRRRQWGPACKK